jgi:ribosomal protein L37E
MKGQANKSYYVKCRGCGGKVLACNSNKKYCTTCKNINKLWARVKDKVEDYEKPSE